MDYRVGHLAYRTQDMQAALDFYTRAPEFPHLFSLAGKNGEPWIEYVGTPDGRFIELFHPTGEEAPAGGGYLHLCLEVDDCAAAVADLEQKGVTIVRPISVGKDGNYQAWIKDPDGRDIEIMQLGPGSEQGKYRDTLKK